MSTYHFIYLHPPLTDDSEILLSLKKKFNSLATTYNTTWPQLSLMERENMINKLAELEWEILDYIHTNKSSPRH